MVNHKEDSLKPVSLTVNIIEAKKDKIGVLPSCHIPDCGKDAVTTGLYLPKNQDFPLCVVHASLFSKSEDLKKVWKVQK